jgi:hypothetical protein
MVGQEREGQIVCQARWELTSRIRDESNVPKRIPFLPRVITTASQAHYGAHIPFDDLNPERSYWGLWPLLLSNSFQPAARDCRGLAALALIGLALGR